jgi:hypothetical protein
LEGRKMTTQQHEAVKLEKAEAAAVMEARATETEEEKAGKETVRGKIVRLVGELRGGRVFGAARKAMWGELEAAAGRLKSEQLMGELTEAEEKAKKEAEKVAKAG